MSATHLSHVEAARDAVSQMAAQTRREREGTGQTAVNARIGNETLTAFVLAIAAERDSGVSNLSIARAIIVTIANLVMTATANISGQEPDRDNMRAMLDAVADAAMSRHGAHTTIGRTVAEPAGSA